MRRKIFFFSFSSGLSLHPTGATQCGVECYVAQDVSSSSYDTHVECYVAQDVFDKACYCLVFGACCFFCFCLFVVFFVCCYFFIGV